MNQLCVVSRKFPSANSIEVPCKDLILMGLIASDRSLAPCEWPTLGWASGFLYSSHQAANLDIKEVSKSGARGEVKISTSVFTWSTGLNGLAVPMGIACGLATDCIWTLHEAVTHSATTSYKRSNARTCFNSREPLSITYRHLNYLLIIINALICPVFINLD